MNGFLTPADTMFKDYNILLVIKPKAAIIAHDRIRDIVDNKNLTFY